MRSNRLFQKNTMGREFLRRIRRHALAWVAVVWLVPAVHAVGESLKLELSSEEVVAQCGDNVTLTCRVSSTGPLDIKSFYWVGRGKLLSKDSLHDPGAATQRNLTLTLTNVMPVHQGRYLCKLHSTTEIKLTSCLVRVKDCLEDSGSRMTSSHAECWFDGFYPNGSVHWFQGDANVTESARTHTDVDQYGRYKATSTIHLGKNLSQPYNCSLWLYDPGTYVTGKQLSVAMAPGTGDDGNAGNAVRLQWVCVMLEIIMLKCML